MLASAAPYETVATGVSIGYMASMASPSNEKKPFLIGLGALLSGLAALVTAAVGLYVVVFPAHEDPEEPLREPATDPDPLTWRAVAEEDFSNTTFGWQVRHQGLGNLDTGAVLGKFRWDGTSDGEYWLAKGISRYTADGDFYIAVDTQLVFSDHKNPLVPQGVMSGLYFGDTGDSLYMFLLSSGETSYSLSHSAQGDTSYVIGPTAIEVEPTESNRLAVMVIDDRIALYANNHFLASYEEPTFAGGAVGLILGGSLPGDIAIVDFDNFELRKP